MQATPQALILVTLALLPIELRAQREPVTHERSSAPSDARFELVQSTLAARSTFRIDKQTGRVDQIVMREDSTLTWQAVRRLEHPAGDPRITGRTNYQLFMSGLANRHTFLVNVNNGATWQLVISKDEVLSWEPIT